jgi:repressor LexA
LTEFPSRLKDLRKEKNLRQKDLATDLGVARTTIANYEQGTRFPDKDVLNKLANYFNVSTDYLLGRIDYPSYLPQGTMPANDMVQIPILGTIQAGRPILVHENIEGYRSTDRNSIKGSDYFFLRVNGDSMIGSRIYPGDLVLVRKQEDVDNGDIAVILINGEEATLKRVFKKNGQLILQPENPKYEPLIFTQGEVRIIGKIVKVEFDV